MRPHVSLDHPVRLTVAEITAVADRRLAVSVSDPAYAAVRRTRDAALTVAATRPVYGRSTGVGANKGIEITERAHHALGLLRSHATSAGELREPRRVRAMLAVRCAQLAAAGSGIAPEVLQALVAILDSDALPPVREYGSIGTGDLSALATTALALLGELAPATPGRVGFDEHDALAFLSSNAAAIGDAALAVHDLSALAHASLATAALTFAAVDGNAEAWSELAESVTPFPGARLVCRTMRALTDGAAAPARIQDPFGLRALPQVHGMCLDSLAALTSVVEALASAAAENPVFRADPPQVAHNGGFHVAYLATALDTARSALAQAAQLSQARLANLVDPELTGLAPFLADGPGASGVMVLEYVAASALAQLRAAATPTAVQTVSISRGAEDDASFAALGASLALASVRAYETVVSCELVAAVRALRMRGLVVPLPVAGLPAELADRDLTDDLRQAAEVLYALAAQPADSSNGRSSSA
ncbi:MAG: histidine ammonia-lyase [Frankiales bacterium]|jgi:histidine ammonia-lyase|nr:histidine ammonia-lyase [Frankiales bacterium]